MDCIVRVIQGLDKDAQAKLPPGPTLVGRAASAGLRLSDPDISWEHLVITRTGDEYSAENLSARGSFIDDAKMATAVKVRLRQQIRLSAQTVVRLEPAEGAGAGTQKLIALGVVALLLIGGTVAWFMWGKSGERPATENWDRAFNILYPWVEQNVAAKRLPADLPDMFVHARRLDQVHQELAARKLWVKMQLDIDRAEPTAQLAAASATHRDALKKLLSPAPGDGQPGDEDLAAALWQYIDRRVTELTKKGDSK